MPTLHVFDPPMCCSTGVCGPAVDPELARFAADCAWLAEQGVAVQRHNLSQQPQAFLDHAAVRAALDEHGDGCLPLVLVDDAIVSRAAYPSRAELARWAGVSAVEHHRGDDPTAASSSCCGSQASAPAPQPAEHRSPCCGPKTSGSASGGCC